MNRMISRIMVTVASAVLLAGCAGLVAPQYGLQEGRLASCEGLRACVSSHAPEDSEYYIEPLEYQGTRSEARDDLVTVVREFNNANLVSNHRSYMRVEFPSSDTRSERGTTVVRTATVDDTEFYFPDDAQRIHVRSTPRRNLPDSGENRDRIEAIRERFEALQGDR